MWLGNQYIGRAIWKAHVVSLPKLPRAADSVSETSTERRLCVCLGRRGEERGVDCCDFEFEPRHVHGCLSVSVCVVLPRAMTETIRNADIRLPHGGTSGWPTEIAPLAIYSADNVGPADCMITAHQSVTTMQGLMRPDHATDQVGIFQCLNVGWGRGGCVPSYSSPCGIWAGQIGTGTDFSPRTSVSSYKFITPAFRIS